MEIGKSLLSVISTHRVSIFILVLPANSTKRNSQSTNFPDEGASCNLSYENRQYNRQ